jgi:hypothetical protein
MDKLSPEMEALITTVIYLDCRIKAIVSLLIEKGITLQTEDIETATRKIHAIEGDVKRYEIFCRMKDGNFDIM